MSTDPLSTLTAAASFANVSTDLVTVGVAVAGFYVVWVGVKWILREIRRA